MLSQFKPKKLRHNHKKIEAFAIWERQVGASSIRVFKYWLMLRFCEVWYNSVLKSCNQCWPTQEIETEGKMQGTTKTLPSEDSQKEYLRSLNRDLRLENKSTHVSVSFRPADQLTSLFICQTNRYSTISIR